MGKGTTGAEGFRNTQGGRGNVTNTTLENILRDTTPGRPTMGRTTQHIRRGGFNQANTDFNNLNPSNVTGFSTANGTGRTGVLPDGRTVTVRSYSSDGRPTLEIRNANNRRRIEIRYDEE